MSNDTVCALAPQLWRTSTRRAFSRPPPPALPLTCFPHPPRPGWPRASVPRDTPRPAPGSSQRPRSQVEPEQAGPPADGEARFDSGAPPVPRAHVERAPAAPHHKVHSPTRPGHRTSSPAAACARRFWTRPWVSRDWLAGTYCTSPIAHPVSSCHPVFDPLVVRVHYSTVMDLSCPRVACLQHRQARARGVLTLTPARAVRSGVLRAHLFQMQACSALSLLRI